MSGRIARWRYRRLIARMAGPRLLRAFAETHPHAFFVEIGANDGEQHDHLRAHVLARPWRGIMVEPVPYVFVRLQRNYGHLADRVALENVAIADEAGRLPFFHVAEAEHGAGTPAWYDAIGSFSREAVLSHANDVPDLEARLVETEVTAIPLADLLERHGAPRPDLILIDTEGYDSTIIRSIDFERHGPRLLIYEHFHLEPGDRDATRSHLYGRGYETKEEGFDTFALRTGTGDPLDKCWRRLRPAVPGVSVHDDA